MFIKNCTFFLDRRTTDQAGITRIRQDQQIIRRAIELNLAWMIFWKKEESIFLFFIDRYFFAFTDEKKTRTVVFS